MFLFTSDMSLKSEEPTELKPTLIWAIRRGQLRPVLITTLMLRCQSVNAIGVSPSARTSHLLGLTSSKLGSCQLIVQS